MSTELYRKYIDIINENSQEPIQLDEGVLGNLAAKVKATVVPQVEKMLGGKLEAVKQAALAAASALTAWLIGWSTPFILLTVAVLLMVA